MGVLSPLGRTRAYYWQSLDGCPTSVRITNGEASELLICAVRTCSAGMAGAPYLCDPDAG